MKCDAVQMLLSDLEEGRLSPEQSAEIRRHLQSCRACADELAAQRRLSLAFKTDEPPIPGPRLRAAFYAWLEAEKRAVGPVQRRGFERSTSWFQRFLVPVTSAVAACVVFAGGLLVGARTLADRPAGRQDLQTVQELAELRRQVAAMREAVAWTMLQQDSTSDRLKTVLALSTANDPGTANELLGILAYDASSSVRLRAVEALSHHAGDATVRFAVAHALAREPSPAVQLALIDLLATTRDPDAAAALDTFARSERPSEVVRDAASLALARM